MFISIIMKVDLMTGVTTMICCDLCTAVRSCGVDDALDGIAFVESVMHETNCLEIVQHPVISMHRNSFYSEEIHALCCMF
jgi:hypothetical protein